MHPNTQEAYELLHDGTLALAKAERQGIRFDEGKALQFKERLSKKIEILEKKFYETEFFKNWQKSSSKTVNIYSNPQLGHYLYDVLEIEPVAFTKSKKGSTSETALKELEIKDINYIIKIRKLKKIRDTYLESFLRESVGGYIHPSFNLHIARTFRSSSNNPNFQNIPKREQEARKITRQCLFPRPGHQLMEIDYGQLEVRIAACYNQDPKLIKDIL
ncbi:MAG: DNA polymerase, partial [Bacteroidales bacterium]